MAEHKYAFLKDDRVLNVIIFDSKNDLEAEQHKNTYGYDDFIYAGTDKAPAMYSVKLDNDFVPADKDYLFSIGLSPYDETTFKEWLEKIGE
jgi:hypothetical protein